eukprot:12427093-Karenia_brevis.AAC.1
MSHLACMMRQWVPVSKFITLSAIINDANEIISAPNSIMTGLCRFWSPVFDGTSTVHDASLAHEVLNSLPKPQWDWSKIKIPDRDQFNQILLHAHDNSPGFDGLAYSAHLTASCNSSILMEKMFAQMRSFDPLDPTHV